MKTTFRDITYEKRTAKKTLTGTGFYGIAHNPLRKGYCVRIDKLSGTAKNIEDALVVRKRLIEKNRLRTGLSIVPADTTTLLDFKPKEKELRKLYLLRRTERYQVKKDRAVADAPSELVLAKPPVSTSVRAKAQKPKEVVSTAQPCSNAKIFVLFFFLLVIACFFAVVISQTLAH